MRRIVIVGAGLAGLRAVQELRTRGFDGEVVILGDEYQQPYNRPPLSKQVLTGQTDPTECLFAHNGLDAWWIRGCAATGLDPEHRVVRLDGDEDLPYDGLVIATGRRATEWPDGTPSMTGLHTLRGMDDAIALRDAVTHNPRVTIIGAGFVGCEVAASLRTRGVDDVNLIDVSPHPMPRLGEDIGRYAARLHTQHGVQMLCGEQVSEFRGAHRIESVKLAGGRDIATDLLLLALGSTPNTEWLNDSGIELHNGNVVCDANCMIPGRQDIVAAGDVAAWPHPVTNRPIHIEHWTNAVEMAKRAATNLLEGPDAAVPYTPVPTFWSDQYDTKLKSAGLFPLTDTTKVIEEDDDFHHIIVEGYRHGELIAATTINDNRAFIDYQRQLQPGYAGSATRS